MEKDPKSRLVFPLITFRLRCVHSRNRCNTVHSWQHAVSNTRCGHFFAQSPDHVLQKCATQQWCRKDLCLRAQQRASLGEIFMRIGAKVQHLTADEGKKAKENSGLRVSVCVIHRMKIYLVFQRWAAHFSKKDEITARYAMHAGISSYTNRVMKNDEMFAKLLSFF